MNRSSAFQATAILIIVFLFVIPIQGQDYFEGCGILERDYEAGCLLFQPLGDDTRYLLNENIWWFYSGDTVYVTGNIDLYCGIWCGTWMMACLYMDSIAWCGQSCCVHSLGDVNSDGKWDVTDLTCYIDWFFCSSEPCLCRDQFCEDAADVNQSGQINISDIIMYINYMFTGGPGPPDCP